MTGAWRTRWRRRRRRGGGRLGGLPLVVPSAFRRKTAVKQGFPASAVSVSALSCQGKLPARLFISFLVFPTRVAAVNARSESKPVWLRESFSCQFSSSALNVHLEGLLTTVIMNLSKSGSN